MLLGTQVFAQANTKGKSKAESHIQTETPSFPRFLSYPTSHKKPIRLDSGNPKEDKEVHALRLQHWYFIFDQAGYVQRYGKLPQSLPEGLSPAQYSQNPPQGAFSADLERYMDKVSGDSGQ